MNAKRIAKIKQILVDEKVDSDRRVQLTEFWDTSPKYWRNFIGSLRMREVDTETNEDRIAIIAAALVDYNAVRLIPHELIFKTVAHKNWFMLRFA